LITAIVLFPPADIVAPARQTTEIGGMTINSPSPEMRYGRGLVFITDIGGQLQIRFAQWYTEMAATACVAAILIGFSVRFESPDLARPRKIIAWLRKSLPPEPKPDSVELIRPKAGPKKPLIDV